MLKISVIIPTYNNENIITLCLDAVFNQTLSKDVYDVIVVNDGSTDGTGETIKELYKKYPFKYINQKNSGPAAARNAGIKAARNDIIVLIQDDIIVDRKFLYEHLKFHKKYDCDNTSVLGFTTWHPHIKVTPFMRWLEHGGPQFDYDRIRGKTLVDYMAFYTANISLRRNFLNENGLFDEHFRVKGATAYEDTELGIRLCKKGLKIYYNPNALAYHWHKKGLKEVLNRQRAMGRMSHLLYRKHPDFNPSGEIRPIKQILRLKTGFLSDEVRYKLTRYLFNEYSVLPLEKIAYFIEDKFNLPLLYKIVCGYWYNKGYREGSK